jgi:spore maturation protein CgeB
MQKYNYKILHVGQFGGGPYRDERIKKAFEYHGCQVIPFGTGKYFNRSNLINRRFNNLKMKYLLGSELKRIKSDLINKIKEVMPDIVFYRDVLLFKHTDWREITEYGSHYNICNVEMDMFSNGNNTYAWKQLKKSLKLFDLHFVFRKKNILDFKKFGYEHAYLREPSYIPWYHKPPEKTNYTKIESDVVFIGHYEDDGRKEYCEYLLKNGIDINIYSTNWKKYIKKKNPLFNCLNDPIYGDKYPQVVYDSKAALCFFSRLNNDELTERVFEIPAMGGVLISERNDRLMELFDEGREILLFSNKEELLNHINFIKENPDKALKIRDAGRAKVIAHHSIFHRAEYALSVISQFIHGNMGRR